MEPELVTIDINIFKIYIVHILIMLKYFSLQTEWEVDVEVDPGQDITSQLAMIAVI